MRDTLLESYLSALERELLAIPTEGKSYNNLSQSEISALSDLKRDRNIVIKGVDKGSAVVVRDRGDYIVEAKRQLSARQVYEEVDRDPTVDLSNIIEGRLQDLIVEVPGIGEYLSSGGGTVCRFYLLPKIHKGLDGVKGRPVISNCGTFTEHI